MFFKSESCPSASRPGCTFDVFLSFRGEDTRKNFTNHLYSALVQAGIHTFRDDNELTRGKEISSQLLKAIHESRISIVIFSKGYASSRWCLNELVEILECKHTYIDQIVLPIFYEIDPCDVRKQTGPFEEAFVRHEACSKKDMDKVKRWREALEEAGNLCGWNLKDMENEKWDKSRFIQKIVEHVLNIFDRKYLNVGKFIVGIESRVGDIIDLLSIDVNDVRLLGIHGMPGIGKTTIAKAVFNQLCFDFEGSSFLSNVKEMSEKPNGLVRLQDQLLCDILKQNVWNIEYVHSGITLIKQRLCCKRVIVILDDVDELKQLDALAGDRSWFGPGSRIIITTRNSRLLTQLEVDTNYQVAKLDSNSSLQLFSRHAFKDTHPIDDFTELSHRIVGYSGGLPLALEVLGSSLFKRSKPEWKSTIDKLQKIPDNQIQKKLRTSFDSLDDSTQKDAFLDIACFFVGWNKEYVAEILDGRGFYAEIAISILVERSLVIINHQNQLDMHDLIRAMGREIIRETSLDNPGKRNRIWFREDVLEVLNKKLGTEAVKGLTLDIQEAEAVNVSTKSFTEMRYLNLLQINGVHLTGSYKYLSKELIWLCWYQCPLKSLRSNFQVDRLVILDMQNSSIKELWKETKVLHKLKILNLSYSKHLIRTPKLRSLSLQKLIFEGCSSLIEVHQSIGYLERLVLVNLEGCLRLKNLPESMGDLKFLETLNITRCSKLEKLPERLGGMESLKELLADATAISQLPSSIANLKKLKKLSLYGCNYSQNLPSASWLSSLNSSWLSPRNSNSNALLSASSFGLCSLRKLYLSYCGLSEGATTCTDLGSLSSLEELDLSGNKFLNLPAGIGSLPKLKSFPVSKCTNLLSISELPSSLQGFDASDCTSMQRISIPSKIRAGLYLGGCRNLIEIQGMEGLGDIWAIALEECNKLSNTFKKSILQALCKAHNYDIILVSGEIPEWFIISHSDGEEVSSLSFQVPPVSDARLQALVVWFLLAVNGRKYCYASTTIRNKRNGILLLKKSVMLAFDKKYDNHSWVRLMTLPRLPWAMESGDELELSVELSDDSIEVKKWGIHLIVNKPVDAERLLDNQETVTDACWKRYLARELQQLQICAVGRGWDPMIYIHRQIHESFVNVV